MKLSEIRKLCEEATPGPWDYEYGVTMRSAWKLEQYKGGDILHLDSDANIDLDVKTGQVEKDMEFIAAARTLLPLLLDVAEAAEQSYHAMIAGADLEAIDTLEEALKKLEEV